MYIQQKVIHTSLERPYTNNALNQRSTSFSMCTSTYNITIVHYFVLTLINAPSQHRDRQKKHKPRIKLREQARRNVDIRRDRHLANRAFLIRMRIGHCSRTHYRRSVITVIFILHRSSPRPSPTPTPSPRIQRRSQFTFSDPKLMDGVLAAMFPAVALSPVMLTRNAHSPTRVADPREQLDVKHTKTSVQKAAALEPCPSYASILKPQGRLKYNPLSYLIPRLRHRTNIVHFHPVVEVHISNDTGIAATVFLEPLANDARNTRQSHFRRCTSMPCLTHTLVE